MFLQFCTTKTSRRMGMDDGGGIGVQANDSNRCRTHGPAVFTWNSWGAWFVPLGSVLDQAGMHSIKPYAFAASAIAAIMSPLFFGAMADRSVPPLKVLRWVSLAAAVTGSWSHWPSNNEPPVGSFAADSNSIALLKSHRKLDRFDRFLAIDWNPSVRSDSILGDDWMDGWLLGGESLRNGHEPPCVLPQRSAVDCTGLLYASTAASQLDTYARPPAYLARKVWLGCDCALAKP